ncbi:MAG: chloramphenicol phosphotransferase [Pseudomonadota bacterium]
MIADAARVIVLNGIGSVGKTSTAKALQELCEEPLLHVSGDAFLEMMPQKLWGHPSWISFSQKAHEGKREVAIQMGEGFEGFMLGMRSAIAELARAGTSCVVDDVMLSAQDQGIYRTALGPIRTHFVALHAPLEVLERREYERGDRLIGLARWQWDRVHKGIEYDFEVETVDHSPRDVAMAIADALGLSVAG